MTDDTDDKLLARQLAEAIRGLRCDRGSDDFWISVATEVIHKAFVDAIERKIAEYRRATVMAMISWPDQPSPDVWTQEDIDRAKVEGKRISDALHPDIPAPTPTASLVERLRAAHKPMDIPAHGATLTINSGPTLYQEAANALESSDVEVRAYREENILRHEMNVTLRTRISELEGALKEIRAVCNPHNMVDESRAVLALRIADAAIEACASAALASKDHADD